MGLREHDRSVNILSVRMIVYEKFGIRPLCWNCRKPKDI